MKIYEIGTGYTPIPAQMGAATEIVVEELTRALLAQGEDVEIIDIASDERAEHKLPIIEVRVPRFFTKADVSLGIVHKLKRVVYSIALAGKLRKILKKTEEKVVLHFHNQYNMFFFLVFVSKKFRKNCLSAYTNHSGVWRLPWEEIRSTIKKRYFQEAFCMKKADIVFVLNKETADNAIRHLKLDAGRFVEIINGVNTEIYHPLAPAQKEQYIRRYGFEGKKVILQVGSVYENKGQERSIRLLASMLKENADLIYAYAGGIVSGEYQSQIKETAKELGVEKQVVYLGSIQPGAELNGLYNMAVATIVSSFFESFSLVMIESLSAGVPVLISGSASISIRNGCVSYSDDRFNEAVERITDEKRQFSKQARQTVLEQFAWSIVAQKYMEEFTNQINKLEEAYV